MLFYGEIATIRPLTERSILQALDLMNDSFVISRITPGSPKPRSCRPDQSTEYESCQLAVSERSLAIPDGALK